jgi:hypothetical protein
VKLEQPAHAVANAYFVGAINRVGTERLGTSANLRAELLLRPAAVCRNRLRDRSN